MPIIALDYAAPPECPGAPAVHQEVLRLLGDAALRGDPLVASGVVRRGADGRYILRLGITQRELSSERELASDSCATLAETAGLLIALSHDPARVEQSVARDVAPPVTEPAPRIWPPAPATTERAPYLPEPPVAGAPVYPTSTTVDSPPTSETSTDVGALVRAGPLFGVGDLPDPHAGGALSVALRLGQYQLEGAFEFGAGVTGTLDRRPNAGAEFLRLSGVARGCRTLVPFSEQSWPLAPAAFSLSGCVGFEVGVLSAAGFGISNPQEGSALWAAPRADLRLALGVIEPLAVYLDLGAAFPVQYPRFVIRGTEAELLVVHQVAPVAGRLGTGLLIGF